jgi:hypothetical protein
MLRIAEIEGSGQVRDHLWRMRQAERRSIVRMIAWNGSCMPWRGQFTSFFRWQQLLRTYRLIHVWKRIGKSIGKSIGGKPMCGRLGL